MSRKIGSAHARHEDCRNGPFKWVLLSFVTICLAVPPFHIECQERKVSVHIIGVVHSGNPKVDHKTLIQKIEGFRPDIVFWEQSEPFKRVFGLMTAFALRIARPPVEQLALQQLSRRHPVIPILGFDTVFSSKKAFVKQWETRDQLFHDALYMSKMSQEDSIAYAGYVSLHNRYMDTLLNGSLDEINMPEVYTMQRPISEMESKSILPLGEKYISDKGLVDAFRQQTAFDKARESYMASFLKRHLVGKGVSTAVVMTGVSHKYFLAQELSAVGHLIIHPGE